MVGAALRMVRDFRDSARRKRAASEDAKLELTWRKAGDCPLRRMLGENLYPAKPFPEVERIEALADATAKRGEFPLHASYGKPGDVRNPDAVRSAADIGRLYRWLVLEKRPDVVVEFGTAFGVSGMYWLSGLEAIGHGELLTFEVNEIWRKIAVDNLGRIGRRFQSISGAFEEKADAALGERRIDIAFIDGIHTSAWVLPQFEEVARRCRAGGAWIGFDDIDFSPDMRDAWETVISDGRVKSAVEVRGHLGLVETF
ncbi:MAG: class I SAM-dependent methyltransferase [Bryobacteraceae bacterium]|nr:class I SAM-dependent methyltransferase [Bryobacteraceae bacterium]